MGYYTYFEITVPTANVEQEKALITELENQLDLSLQELIKWYNFEADMITFSKLHPEHIFHIRGEGEEREDVWEARFRNGEHEEVRPEVIWPIFEKITLSSEPETQADYLDIPAKTQEAATFEDKLTTDARTKVTDFRKNSDS